MSPGENGRAADAAPDGAPATAQLTAIRKALDAIRAQVDEIERQLGGPARKSRRRKGTAPARGSDAAKNGDRGAADRSPQGDQRAAALIRASQLAVQGETRGRIEQVLRADFGIADPETIVDEVLSRRR